MGVRTAVLCPGEEDLPYLEVKTLRAKGSVRCAITCHQLYECYTHFIGGRTLPCVEDGCAGCKAARPARYEAFASVVTLPDRKHQLLRLTRNAVLMLKSGVGPVTSLRGVFMLVERKGSRENGRLCVEVSSDTVPTERLPESPVIFAHLSRIWRIDGLEVLCDERAFVAQLQAFVDDVEASREVKDAG